MSMRIINLTRPGLLLKNREAETYLDSKICHFLQEHKITRIQEICSKSNLRCLKVGLIELNIKAKFDRSISLLTATFALLSITGASVLVLSSSFIIIFYLNYISFSELGLLLAFFTIAITIFDYPTGTLADTIGTKKVLFLAYSTLGISLTILFLSNTFFGFLIAQFLSGFGYAQLSGTLEAWYINNY
ncbi:MAG: MFS transporter, partial [Candidatus Hodarchaeota archaeon]